MKKTVTINLSLKEGDVVVEKELTHSVENETNKDIPYDYYIRHDGQIIHFINDQRIKNLITLLQTALEYTH